MIGSRKLPVVQIMRFFAASAVIAAHADQRAAIAFSDIYQNRVIFSFQHLRQLGFCGVDLFFIISGFIMVWVSFDKFKIAGSPLQFMKHRLIRIVPPYWVYTSLALIILVFAPSLFNNAPYLDWKWIICSYIFIPAIDPLGRQLPLLFVGWTLNYEMYFYIIFAILLSFRIHIAIISITIFFLLSSVIGSLYSFTFPLLIQNTSWILLEFVFGIWIGYFFRRSHWLSKSVSYVLLSVGGLVLMLTIIYFPESLSFGFGLYSQRLLLWGIPLALIFAAIVSLFRSLPDNWLVRSMEQAGDASYSIYLFQLFALPGFAYIFKFAGLDRFIHIDLLILALVICSIFAGYIAYLVVEKPMTSFVRKKLISK